jgi:DNA (cytosine-5)-methyltransferase 1
MQIQKYKFYAIDLFAGCGGLSEGFSQAGFKVIARVEMDRWACETLKTRCLYYKLKEKRCLCLHYKYLKGKITKDEIYSRFPDIKKEIDLEIIQAEFGKDNFGEILNRVEDVKKHYKLPKFHVVLGGPPVSHIR